MTREDKDRRIFAIYAATRLAGLATFLFGIAVAFTGLVRPGGWPTLGAILAMIGVLDAVLVPPFVRRALDKKLGE